MSGVVAGCLFCVRNVEVGGSSPLTSTLRALLEPAVDDSLKIAHNPVAQISDGFCSTQPRVAPSDTRQSCAGESPT